MTRIVYRRRIFCRGCKKPFRVHGPPLKVKLTKGDRYWLVTFPDLCCHAYAGGDTIREALREIGDAVCGVLSCFGAKEDICCHGNLRLKEARKKGIKHKNCFQWGKWRKHFGPYIQDVIHA